MKKRACILSNGIWQIRDIVRSATGFDLVYGRGRSHQVEFDHVIGWARRPASTEAMKLAQQTQKPYISIEDGFLRSVYPAKRERPASLVMDTTGVHYDANSASDFEREVARACHISDSVTLRRARRGMDLLREKALSKYNHCPLKNERQLGLGPRPQAGRVLVVDQTMGDGAISYGMASAQSFNQMLQAAKAENPGAQIIVKSHPVVISGRKLGYLTDDLGEGVHLVADAVNPWSLIEAADKVYAVTSLLGFEALLAGREVHCFGAAFYSGWGLTFDRVEVARRTARPTLEQLFAAAYLNYARYADPASGDLIAFEDAADLLAKRRDIALSGWGRRSYFRLADVFTRPGYGLARAIKLAS